MNRITIFWFFAVALASSVWCVTSARTQGVTFDEPTYFENGLHFWRTGSHRTLMKLGTMPLPIDVQTLPLAIAERINGVEYQLDDVPRMIPWMRHGNLAFWWLLLLYGYRHGKELAGEWGGRLAMAGIAFEPNLLAHAALATTDIAITSTVVAFAFHFRRGQHGTWWQRIGVPGVWYGVALLCKASALVFVPLCMVAIAVVTCESRTDIRKTIRTFITDAIGIGLLGFSVALVGCGSDFEPERSFVRWADTLPDGPMHAIMTWLANHLRIFGNAGECLVMQIKHNMRGHGQFLLGTGSKQPFWYYFPVIFSIKLTVPMLAGVVATLVARPAAIRQNVPLACAAILFAFSFSCRVQIGIRLQFACLAFLTIGLAIIAARHAKWAGFIAMAWMAWSAVAIWPDGLRYTNELWGGPDRSYLLMSDSNYDWGQGLPELDEWNKSRGGLPLDVWYFGRDPRLKTMPVRDLPLHCVPLKSPSDMPHYIHGRYLAVGTSVRHCFELSDAHRYANQFLDGFEPVARTRSFVIYDLTKVKESP